MLKFVNKKGKVTMIEHDDGTVEILDKDMKKKAELEEDDSECPQS